ncbi:MAG: SDR family NAD(P)-dependent oxidoreductase [Cardiobacteriaceae bacterium]|nr:SDR family NAD(P)-dependent oxidoreductase [Cardiobacteriaceae bacterium]
MARSILITGCSSGIGYAAAHELHRRGWQVFATARDAQDVERLKSEGLLATRLNLEESDSIQMALEWVLKQTGGTLDALFNNGAYAIPAAVEDLSRAALRQQLEHGLLGWHDLTVRVIPIMRKQGRGRIVQNSSVLGLVSMCYRGSYCAMKYALEALSDAMRLELQGTGITVSLIEPGPIRSQFRQNAYRAFKRWVNVQASHHQAAYQQMINRLDSTHPAPFTLEPDAVVSALVHALEADRPKARYFVTKATWIMVAMKRLLPTAWHDRVSQHLSKKEGEHYPPKNES